VSLIISCSSTFFKKQRIGRKKRKYIHSLKRKSLLMIICVHIRLNGET
jgi:hypothetical protein